MGGQSKQKPTGQERALAEIGTKEWNRFYDRFRPVIHDNVERNRAKTSDLHDMGASASGQMAAGMAPLQPGGRDQATVLQAHGAAAGQAAVVGDTRSAGRAELMQREIRGLTSATALGRGIADQGTSGMAQAGRYAQAAASARQAQDLQFRQGLISAASSGVGAYGQYQGWFDPKVAPAHSGHRNTAT